MGRRRGSKPTFEHGKWRIRWVDHARQRRSEVFDNVDDAHNELRRHELEVEDIRRGLRPAVRAPDKTLGNLFDYWLAKRAPHKRTEYDDQSIIKKHLRPAFGHVRLRDFSSAHVDAFVDERSYLNQKTVRNLLTLLITTLNVAKNDLRWIPEVPHIKKPKSKDSKEPLRYLQTDQEIARLLRAAFEIGEQAHTLCAVAVYTGLRLGELAGLRWSDIDLGRRLIVVQRSFNGPTKSGRTRYVPILDPLLPLLRARRLRCPLDVVFPNRRGKMHVASARIFKVTFRKVLRRAGFEDRTVIIKRPDPVTGGLREIVSKRPYIRFHDLRHTFASTWVMKGGDIFKLQKILGHSTIQMTMRYAHLAPHAFTEDFGRFGSPALAAQVTEVVELATQKLKTK